MPAHRSLDSSTAHLPVSMRGAQGLDLSWKEQARCLPPATDLPGFAWTVEPTDRGPLLLGRPAEAWIEMALMICQNCPAQYGCVRHALRVPEGWGTWGVAIDDLKKLGRLGLERAIAIIDAAEASGTPVQVAVRRAHGPHAMRRGKVDR